MLHKIKCNKKINLKMNIGLWLINFNLFFLCAITCKKTLFLVGYILQETIIPYCLLFLLFFGVCNNYYNNAHHADIRQYYTYHQLNTKLVALKLLQAL